MSDFTEGDWVVEIYPGGGTGGVYIYPEGKDLCIPIVEDVDAKFINLIAASKDMYEALEEALDLLDMDNMWHESQEMKKKIIAILAKASGESNG